MNILQTIWKLLGDSSDQIVALSAACAALFAFLGLRTWRKELKGKSEYQKAKDVLKAVYKVREAFKHVRRVIIYSYEYPENMTDQHGHLKEEFEHEGTTHVYETRWKVLDEAFQELEDQALDAQVEWGPDFQETIVPLRERRADLLIALKRFLKSKKKDYHREISDVEWKDVECKIEYLGENSRNDTFTPEIKDAVDEFERRLRPYIKR